jgi:hypothetical protein
MSDNKLHEAQNLATPPDRLAELADESLELAILIIGIILFFFLIVKIIILSMIIIYLITMLLSYLNKVTNYIAKKLFKTQLKQNTRYEYSDIFQQDLVTAKNLNTSAVVLCELSSSRWLKVREAVAANPNTDAKALKKLAQDEAPQLEALIVKHLNTPVKVFIEFAQSLNISKKIMTAKSFKTPLSTLKYLARYKKSEQVWLEAIRTIAKYYPNELANVLADSVEKVRFPTAARLFVLLHPTAPSDFLSRHYKSLDWRERYAVAQNPNTPINILEKLILDANCIVRATAKARL